MKNINLEFIIRNAIIAALYAALTYALGPLSYNGVQFRISEIMILLVVFNHKYVIGLTIGCLIANIGSPMAFDMLFGTLATLVSLLLMTRFKNLFIAALFPILINGFVIGFELNWLLELPFWLSVGQVMFGEAVVLYLVGIPVLSNLVNREEFVDALKLDIKEPKKVSNIFLLFGLSLALGIIFYMLPLNNEFTTLHFALENYIFFIPILLNILFILLYFIKNNKLLLVSTIILAASYIGFTIALGVLNKELFSVTFYYFIFVVELIICPLFYYINKQKD